MMEDLPAFVRFTGARCTYNDDGEREFTPREAIWINPRMIAGFYEHTILINGQKIRVMESIDQIQRELRSWRW